MNGLIDKYYNIYETCAQRRSASPRFPSLAASLSVSLGPVGRLTRHIPSLSGDGESRPRQLQQIRGLGEMGGGGRKKTKKRGGGEGRGLRRRTEQGR